MPRPRSTGPDRGQAAVELALVLPVVVLLLLAVVQVGLVARDVVLVAHASREAARAAATDSDPGAARAAALASSGLDGDRLEVTVSGRAGPGSRVRVVVTYRAPTSVPLVGALLGDRTLRATTTMRVEHPALVRGCTKCANQVMMVDVPGESGPEVTNGGRIWRASGRTGTT